MRKIKTVIKSIDDCKGFDSEINILLSTGWKLKTRKTIDMAGLPSESFNTPIVKALYAELEYSGYHYEEVTL